MNNTKLSRLAVALTCIGGLALVSSVATAAPLVTQWEYSTNATFLSAAFGGGTNTAQGQSIVSDYELSWGRSIATGGQNFNTPSTDFNVNRSALTIGNGDGTGGTSLTGGGPVTGNAV